MANRTQASHSRPHVVIVGGGFGGMAAARKLRHADVDITLIDRHVYNTFQPLLYQVATASLNPGDITSFLRATRASQKNIHFLKGTAVTMDHATKTVNLDGNITVEYDYLIIATGVTANFFGIPGAAEYALPLYLRSQALAVRDEIFANFEDFAINGQDRELRIAIVGGGATGVETAGALAEMRNLDMPVTYPELDNSKIHVSLIEMGPDLVAPFKEKLRDYTAKQLEKRGVDLRLNTTVKEVSAHGVQIEADGKVSFLEAEVVIWASGITVHDIVKNWGVPQGRGGRIEVDSHQRVIGFDDVFAIGDISINDENPLAQLGQPAIQGGKYVAKEIKAAIQGKEVKKPFKYFDKGTMATIGRSSAIAQINHFPLLRGFIAWAIWVFVHVAYLLSNRNRLSTMTNLSVKYLFKRSHNSIVGDTPFVLSKSHKVIGAQSSTQESQKPHEPKD